MRFDGVLMALPLSRPELIHVQDLLSGRPSEEALGPMREDQPT
jgi:hypothetical protein